MAKRGLVAITELLFVTPIAPAMKRNGRTRTFMMITRTIVSSVA